MAKFNLTKKDVKNIGIGFGSGVIAAVVTDKLVIPAVKKGIQKKKSVTATVDVNIKNPTTPTPETNSEN